MGQKGAREARNHGEEKMNKRKTFLLVAGYLLISALAGCGYTTRSMISDKFKTIYIVPFVNKIDITNEVYTGREYKIYRPMLETDITRKVTNKFLFDGNLKPTREESADLILKGELIDFRKDPLRYNENDDVTEYRINVVVNITLWDRKLDKQVWQENGFTGFVDYFTSGYQAKSEVAAITNAIDDLARRIVERAVEQW